MSLFGEDDTPDGNKFDSQTDNQTYGDDAIPTVPAAAQQTVDLSQGHHQFVFPSGDEYVGDWLDNKMHGEGTLYLNVPKDVTAPTVLISFKGSFEHGIPIEGVAEYADGSNYEGPLSNGLSHGVGVYTKGGLSITGQFAEGVPLGVVDVTFNDGVDLTTYQGKLEYDMLHDEHATLIYPYNSPIKSYTGAFAHNKRHGWGLLTYNVDALREKQLKERAQLEQLQSDEDASTESLPVPAPETSGSVLQQATHEGFFYLPGTNIRLSPSYNSLDSSQIYSIFGYFIDHVLHHGVIFYTDGSIYIGQITGAGAASRYATTSITSLQGPTSRTNPPGGRPASSSPMGGDGSSVLNPFSPGEVMYARQGVGVLAMPSGSITCGLWHLDLPQQQSTTFYFRPNKTVSRSHETSTPSATSMLSIDTITSPLATHSPFDAFATTLLSQATHLLPTVSHPEVAPPASMMQSRMYYNSTEEQPMQGPIIKALSSQALLSLIVPSIEAHFVSHAPQKNQLCLEGIFSGTFQRGQRIGLGVYLSISRYTSEQNSTYLAPPLVGLNGALYALYYGLWSEDAPHGAGEILFAQNDPLCESSSSTAPSDTVYSSYHHNLLQISRALAIAVSFQNDSILDPLAIAPELLPSQTSTKSLHDLSQASVSEASQPQGEATNLAPQQQLSYFNGTVFCGVRESGLTVFTNNAVFSGRYVCPTEDQITKSISRNHCQDAKTFLHADFYRNNAQYRAYVNAFCEGKPSSASPTAGAAMKRSGGSPSLDTFSQRYLRAAASLNVVRGDSTFGDAIGSCQFGTYIYPPQLSPSGHTYVTLWIGALDRFIRRHGKGVYCRDLDIYALLSSSYRYQQSIQPQQQYSGHGSRQHSFQQQSSALHYSQLPQNATQYHQQQQQQQYFHIVQQFFQNYQHGFKSINGSTSSSTAASTYALLETLSSAPTYANLVADTLPVDQIQTHALPSQALPSPRAAAAAASKEESMMNGIYPLFHPVHLLYHHCLFSYVKYELNDNTDAFVTNFAKHYRTKTSPASRLLKHSAYIVVGDFVNDITYHSSIYYFNGVWQGSTLSLHPTIANSSSNSRDVASGEDQESEKNKTRGNPPSPLVTLSSTNLEATAHFLKQSKYKSYTDVISIIQDAQAKLGKLYAKESPFLVSQPSTMTKDGQSASAYCASIIDCYPSHAGVFSYSNNYVYTGYALNITWDDLSKAFPIAKSLFESNTTVSADEFREVDPNNPSTLLQHYLRALLEIRKIIKADTFVNHHQTNYHRLIQLLDFLEDSSASQQDQPASDSLVSLFVDGTLSKSSSPDIYVGNLVDIMPIYQLPSREYLAQQSETLHGDDGLPSEDSHAQVQPRASSASSHDVQDGQQISDSQTTPSSRFLYGNRTQQPLRHGKGNITAGNISKRKIFGDFYLDQAIRGIETDDLGDTYIGTFDENNQRNGKYIVCLALRKWVSMCYYSHGAITHGKVWYNVSESVIQYISTQLQPIEVEQFDFDAYLIQYYQEQLQLDDKKQHASQVEEHIYDSDDDSGIVRGYVGPEDDTSHTLCEADDYLSQGIIDKYFTTVNDDSDKATEIIYEDEVVEIVHNLTDGVSLDVGQADPEQDTTTSSSDEKGDKVSDSQPTPEDGEDDDKPSNTNPSTLVRVSAEGLACFDIDYTLRLSQIRTNRGWRYRLPQPDCLGQLSRWYYCGDLDDTFLPHGQGEMYWLTTTTLQQQVELLSRRDYAVMNTMNPGAPANYYKGQFDHGVLHGEGIVYYHTPSDYAHVDFNMATSVSSSFLAPCASTFTGVFAHGVPSAGEVVFDPASFAYGQTLKQYTGELNDAGYLHGQGTIVYASGDTFAGTLHHNYPVHGTIQFTNGITFTGDLHTTPYAEYLLNPFYFNLLSTKQSLERSDHRSMGGWSSAPTATSEGQSNPQQLECERVTYANSFNLTYSLLLQCIIQFLAYYQKPESGFQEVPLPLAVRTLVSIFHTQHDNSQQQLKEIIASIQEYQQLRDAQQVVVDSPQSLASVLPSEETDTRLCLVPIPQEIELHDKLIQYMTRTCLNNTALLPPLESKVFSGKLPHDKDLQEQLARFISFITTSLVHDSVYIYLNGRLTIVSSKQVSRFIGPGTISISKDGGNKTSYTDALSTAQHLHPASEGIHQNCYSDKCREIINQTMTICFTNSLNLISQLNSRQSWPMVLLPSSVADPSLPDYFTRYPREKGTTAIKQEQHKQIGYHDVKETVAITVATPAQRLDSALSDALEDIQEKTNQRSNEYIKEYVHSMLTNLRQTEVLLANIKLTLETEEKEDDYCRKRFGESMWTPTPSSTLTSPLWSQYEASMLQHQQQQQGSTSFLQSKSTYEYIFDILDVNLSHWEQRLWRQESTDIHRLKVVWFIHRLRHGLQKRRLQFAKLLQQLVKSDNMLLLLSHTSRLEIDPNNPPDLQVLTQKMIRRLLVAAKQEYTDINHTNELIDGEIRKFITAHTAFQGKLMELQVREKTKVQQPLQHAMHQFTSLLSTVERLTRDIEHTNTALQELYGKTKEMFQRRQQERQQHSRLLLSEELQQVILTNDLRKVYALIFTCCYYQKQLFEQQQGSTLHDGMVLKTSSPTLDLHAIGHMSQLSPLQLAVSRGLTSMTTLLYKMGCSLLQRTSQGKTLALVAIEHGHPEMVSTLVRLGYPLNRIEHESSRTTLLHHVVKTFGNGDLVKYLLYLGANPNALNSDDQTPLMLACQKYHHIVQTKQYEISATGKEPQELTNVHEIITSLIQFGTRLNTRDSQGNTALHHLFGSYLSTATSAIPSVIRNTVILLVSKGARHRDGIRNVSKQPPSHPSMIKEMDTTRQNFISQAEQYKFTLLPLNSNDAAWQADLNADQCIECNSVFTMFNRRHHCRLCGKLFCDPCTKSSLYSTTLNGSLRTCSSCFNLLSLNIIAYEQTSFQSKNSQLHINMTTLMLYQEELRQLEDSLTHNATISAPLGASLTSSIVNGFSPLDNIDVDQVATTQPMIVTFSTSKAPTVTRDALRGAAIRPQTQLSMLPVNTIPTLKFDDAKAQSELQTVLDLYISITQQSQKKKLPRTEGFDVGEIEDEEPAPKQPMLENEYVLIQVEKKPKSSQEDNAPDHDVVHDDDDDDDSDDLMGDLRR